MPRILRRDIWRSTVKLFALFGVISLVGVFFFQSDITRLYGVLFDGYVILFLFNSWFTSLRLPDYIFLAPYSYEMREDLVQKKFAMNLIANMAVFWIFIVVPNIIFYFMEGGQQYLFHILYGLIILSGIVYLFSYIKYFDECAPGRSVSLDFICVLLFSVPAACRWDAGQSGRDHIFSGIACVVATLTVLYYHRRYFKEMVTHYADYERCRMIKG